MEFFEIVKAEWFETRLLNSESVDSDRRDVDSQTFKSSGLGGITASREGPLKVRGVLMDGTNVTPTGVIAKTLLAGATLNQLECTEV